MATRADIRTRARIRADQDNSTFPTDTQYNLLIDEAAKEVWYDLVQAGWPVRFLTASVTPAGAQYVALPATDTVFVRGVYRIDASNQYVELRRIQEGDRASLLSSTGNSATVYDLVMSSTGPSVELLPRDSSHTFVVEYVREYAGFSGDSDTWFGPARSDEMIVLLAAIKGMRKEGNDQGATQLEKEYARLFEKVVNMASWLNMRNPPTIRDVGGGPGISSAQRFPFDFDI